MAVQRRTPPRVDSQQSRMARTRAFPRPESQGGRSSSGLMPPMDSFSRSSQRSQSALRQNPTFNRLTVVWVQRSGVPFNTEGFTATVSRDNQIVDRAAFDSFGVVRFNNIPTPTSTNLTMRVFDRNGVVFRTRIIPAGVAVFAIIG